MRTKQLLSFAIGWLFLATFPFSGLAQPGSENRDSTASVRDRFIGAWRLAWLEEESSDGRVQKADCTGLLVYTADGHMSVQVMYRNAPPAPKGGQVQYAQGGYEASFGRYAIDEASHAFTYHVEGALVRALIGKDLRRVYEFSGKQLIVKSSNPSEHWKVAWEHY